MKQNSTFIGISVLVGILVVMFVTWYYQSISAVFISIGVSFILLLVVFLSSRSQLKSKTEKKPTKLIGITLFILILAMLSVVFALSMLALNMFGAG